MDTRNDRQSFNCILSSYKYFAWKKRFLSLIRLLEFQKPDEVTSINYSRFSLT